MKSNVESRIKNYVQQLEKFHERWNGLKPSDDVLEGDGGKLEQAMTFIKEKQQEFEELDKTRLSVL